MGGEAEFYKQCFFTYVILSPPLQNMYFKRLIILITTFTILFVCKASESDYDYVDLGLSVKWATKNVGAKVVADYGDYFAWAELTPKEQYDWTTYKYTESGATRMTKYNYTSMGATIDFLTELEADDDAATFNLGSNWRTPDLEEYNELIENCTWIWHNNYQGSGINGFLITSKIPGYTQNSIFLPAAGHYGGKNPYDINQGGMYWSSSLDKNSFAHIKACQLYFGSGDVCTMSYDREIGMTIRAVYSPKKEQLKDYDISGIVQGHEYVDLGLSVQWATCNIGANIPKQGGCLYSWAEIEPKDKYLIENYKYSNNGSYSSMSKYNEADGLTVLESVDDAASNNWGDEWRTPTEDEFNELIDNCEWHQLNGCIYGISKINNNVIVLSCVTGCRDDSYYNNRTSDGCYWTANRGIDVQRGCAWIYRKDGLYGYFTNNVNRYFGHAVRPVLKTQHQDTLIETIDKDIDTNFCDGVFLIGNRIIIKKGVDLFNVNGVRVTNIE